MFKDNRVGESRKMNCGLIATIIEYKASNNIKVQFEDGYIVNRANYHSFKRGLVSHKTIRVPVKHRYNVGDTKINKDGELIELIRYKDKFDVDIKFEDGYIWKNTRISNFARGAHNPNKAKHRIGTHKLMNCGLSAKIIGYKDSADIDIEFEDGTIVNNVRYSSFKEGSIAHPNINVRSNNLRLKRIGEKRVNNKGQLVELIDYRGANDIDVKINDTIIRNREYSAFLNGTISANGHSQLADTRLGETIISNCGFKATLVKYRDATDVDIKFEDGTVVKHKKYREFTNGTILHPGFTNGYYHGLINNINIYGLITKDAKIYKCKCKECNREMLLTPQLILKHKCSN